MNYDACVRAYTHSVTYYRLNLRSFKTLRLDILKNLPVSLLGKVIIILFFLIYDKLILMYEAKNNYIKVNYKVSKFRQTEFSL